MKFIKDIRSVKTKTGSYFISLFYCEQCKKEVEKVKGNGQRVQYCSKACSYAARGANVGAGAAQEAARAKRQAKIYTCDKCGKEGNRRDIFKMRQEYWCSDCASPLTGCDYYDYSRNGLSSLAVII